MGKPFWQKLNGSVATVCVTLGLASWSLAQTVDPVVEQELRENKASAESQDRIDKLADDIDAKAAAYRAALQETRQLKVYNRQLEALIESQQSETESLRRQIDNVAVVSRQVLPLMEEMVDVLDQFVQLDVPFLLEERTTRVAGLRELMLRADVSTSEKYRRIFEAYQVENEYGRTIEAYRGRLSIDAKDLSVDFLRIGRNALLYQTLDGEASGAWDAEQRSWKPLDDSYRLSIRDGLRMARKQVAPDLLELPIPVAVASNLAADSVALTDSAPPATLDGGVE